MIRRIVRPSFRQLPWPVLCLLLIAATLQGQSSAMAHQRLGGPVFITAPFASLAANPTSVAVGDLNGDGKPDLVVTKAGSSSVTVMLGDGRGGFGLGVEYVAGTQPANAHLADLDGDGKLDLVVTDSASGAIVVLRGNGDGTFAKPASFAAVQNPMGLAVGNFRGKGTVDLAVFGSTGLSILLNDGSGRFPSATALHIGSQLASLAAADLKGTGHDDLILGNADGTLSILLGDGSGNFVPLTAQGVGSSPLSAVVVADFNGDGKPDLAVTQAASGTLSVLLGRGDGTFAAGASYPVDNGPTALIAANLTGDGVADLVTANKAANTFSVMLGNGDGSFRPSIDYVSGNVPLALAAADFNSDGHLDLAVVNSQAASISVPLGAGDGTFSAARAYKAGLQSRAIASGDLNGDGRPDLVVANTCGSDAACASSGTATVFLANPDGSYRQASTLALGSGPVAVALADLNGDGMLDLLALNRNDRTLTVMPGDGDGTFGQPQVNSLSAAPRALFVGDFNANGVPDLAIAFDCGQTVCTQPGAVEIWMGSKHGSPAPSASYSVGYSPVSIAAGDLRGTGHFDLLVANACGDDSTCQANGTATLLAGDGAGKFKATGSFDIGKAPSAIALGNLSGSGLDLAVAQRGANQVAVMHSNGSGGFGAPVTYAVGAAPAALAIADFNGDGKPDLAVANFQSSTVSVLNGTGAGSLQSPRTYSVATGPESLAVVAAGAGRPAGLATANGNSGATPQGRDVTMLTLQPLAATTPAAHVTANPATAVVDQSEVLTDLITGTAGTAPSGTVTFSSANTANLVCAESTNAPQDGTVPFSTSDAAAGTATATCTTASLLAHSGDTITALYNGDANYNTISGTAALTISAAATSSLVKSSSTNNTSAVNGSVTFTATVSAPAGATIPLAGSVTFSDNGAVITSGSSCGTAGVVPITWVLATATGAAACTTSALAAGTHAIIATYGANTNYATSNNNVTQTVTAIASTTALTSSSTANTSTINEAVTLTATVTPSNGAVPLTGNVAFTDGGGPVAGCTVSFTASTGKATCTTSTLSLGAHTLKAVYAGDASYTTSNSSITQTVNQGSTTTTISTSNTSPAVNQQVTLTATVTPNPTGATKLSGSVTFTDTPQGGSAVAICSNIAVSPSTGIATCTDSWAAAATHTITAAYANDTNFTGSDTNASPVTESVGKSGTTLALATSVNPATVNQTPAVVFTATVTETGGGKTPLNGTVEFSDNATPISTCTAVAPTSAGVAACADPALTAAGSPHTITAQYQNDTNLGGSTASLASTETVNAAATSLALVSFPAATASFNQSVTFAATVTAPSVSGGVPLSGTVNFVDSVTGLSIPGCSAVSPNGASLAQCVTTGLAIGSHTVTATYGSDANFSTSNKSVGLNVGAASTNVAVASNSNPSVVNASVILSATVSSAAQGSSTFTGNMSFLVNGPAITGCSNLPVNGTTGVAQCVTSALPVGADTISAVYAGDSAFGGASGNLVQTVNQSNSFTLALTSPTNSAPVEFGASITFTAAITPAYGGTIALNGAMVFSDNYTAPTGATTLVTLCSVAAGSANFSAAGVATCTATLPDGAHSIVASYTGDAKLTATSPAVTQTINDYALTVAPVPQNALGVLITQGFTGATDPYPAQPLVLTPSSVSAYSGTLTTLTCAPTPPSTAAPTCKVGAASLPVVTTGVQPSTSIILDATNATPGTYTYTVTATDGHLVHTTTFRATVRSLSSPITVTSGATSGNTATFTINLPANVSLNLTNSTQTSGGSCVSVVGPEITTPLTTTSLSIGCTFTPLAIAASGSAQSVPVTITLSTGGAIAANQSGRSSGLLLAGLFGLPLFTLIGLVRGRKSVRAILFRAVAVVAIAAAAWQMSGCGGSFQGSSTNTGGGMTPPGVYNILVQSTGSDNNTYQAVVQLNVKL